MGEWRPVPGYEGHYDVSEDGHVRGYWAGGQRPLAVPALRVQTMTQGRKFVGLSKDGKSKRVAVHRVVALAFIGPCPSELTVNHIDGNRLNNHVSNLEYISAAANRQHATDNLLIAHGERVNTCRLTAEIVRAMRAERLAGDTLKTIAERHGIGISQTHLIVVRKSWKHVA